MAETTAQPPHVPDAEKRFEDGETYSVRAISQGIGYRSNKVVMHAIRTGGLRAKQPHPDAHFLIEGFEANRWWKAADYEPPANSVVCPAPEVSSSRRRSGKRMPILR